MAQCQSVILEDQGLGFNLQRRLFGKKGLRDAPRTDTEEHVKVDNF